MLAKTFLKAFEDYLAAIGKSEEQLRQSGAPSAYIIKFYGFDGGGFRAGVSVENKETTFRINHLKRTPAQTKFLSLEPLLEQLPNLELEGIDWVIVGGESGSKARKMEKSKSRISHSSLSNGAVKTKRRLGES